MVENEIHSAAGFLQGIQIEQVGFVQINLIQYPGRYLAACRWKNYPSL